jgi:ABC-type amino acid transport substrate-binding protein
MTKKVKYLWSKNIIKDSDVFISHASKGQRINSIKDLFGKKVVGIIGYFYPGIDKDFSKNQAQRINVKTEQQIISVISGNRYDVGIVSHSTLMYHFSLNQSLKEILRVSDKEKTSYFRSIYSTKDMHLESQEIGRTLELPEFKSEFSKILSNNLLNLSK